MSGPSEGRPHYLPPFTHFADTAHRVEDGFLGSFDGPNGRMFEGMPSSQHLSLGQPPPSTQPPQPTQSRFMHDAMQPSLHQPMFPSFEPSRGPENYTFPPLQASGPPPSAALACSSRVRIEDIDPARIPLPRSHGDADLRHAPTIAEALGHSPSQRLAGSRRKGKSVAPASSACEARRKAKGKQRAEDEGPACPPVVLKRKRAEDDAGDDVDDSRPAKRGRPLGSRSYSEQDQEALLDLVARELPLAQRGWQRIEAAFARWAKAHSRPNRSLKSLETKYKQLVKTTKPTGDGVCPPLVERAHAIEDLINEKAGTRDLDDAEFADHGASDIGEHSDDDDGLGDDLEQEATFTATVARPPVPVDRRSSARHPPPQPRRVQGNKLLDNLSHILDPDVQRARDEERSARSLQQTQLFAATQQLRDANSLVETLRSQLAELRERLHHTERDLDRAEFRLELADLNARHTPQRHTHSRQPSPYYRRYTKTNPPTNYRTREKRKQHYNIQFPEGGGCFGYLSEPSETEDYAWPPRARSRTPPSPPVITDRGLVPGIGQSPSPRRPYNTPTAPRSTAGRDEDTIMADAPGATDLLRGVSQRQPASPNSAHADDAANSEEELYTDWSASPTRK